MQDEVHLVEWPWPGQLAVAPRPRGGDWLQAEVFAWRSKHIDAVVSLLEPQEVEVLDLQDEAGICVSNRIDSISFPIQDRSIPASYSEAVELLRDLDSRLSRDENILIHCRQGVGRTGIIAAVLFIHRGFDPQTAVEQVTRARGIPVPETVGLARPFGGWTGVNWAKSVPQVT